MSTNSEDGYTFRPSLQDISLKRFRLRYCAVNDCYYLHWDSAVCPQLARIEGLMNGVYAASGVERRQDEREAYICCEDGVDVGRVQWKIDFSDCGLVVSRVQVKVKWVDFEEEVEEPAQFTMVGDDNVMCAPYLGERAVEIPEMVGCRSITLMASLHQPSDTAPVQLLQGETEKAGDCPLDIIIDLMCPHREYLSFVGELLLGLKYTPEEAEEGNSSNNDENNGDIPVIREGKGQLHIHVVEGAGIFDEDTRKPFNAVVKCDLLPDTGRYSSKQTSPRHNAYPTWVKEFVFSGLSRQDLVQGGLEVLVCDHHHFLSDSNIGGVRLCVPQRSNPYKSVSASPDTSPASSRSNSPIPAEINGDHDFPIDGEEHLSHQLNLSNSSPRISSRPNSTSKTLPSSFSHSPTTLSPISLRRAPSPSPRLSPSTLSPVVYRRNKSLSNSPKNSPIMAAKNFFRLSGSHLRDLSPLSSPRNSPLPTRKKTRKFGSRGSSMESEFIFWWMEEVTAGEAKHWQQMLKCEGEWVYFWHVLQPKLKPAYS